MFHVCVHWDLKYCDQFDVLQHGECLLQQIERNITGAMHVATLCESMTWARWPQLRSAREPEGLSDLGRKQQHSLPCLLAFTLNCCWFLCVTGVSLALEIFKSLGTGIRKAP